MLNPFPIQWLSFFAYALLRWVVGSVLLYLGISHIRHRHDLKHTFTLRLFPYGLFSVWYFGLIEIAVGVMYILGFYTQYAALVVIIMSIKLLIFKRLLASEYMPGAYFYILLFGASLSLFITGAGPFAFDLPI